MLVRASLHVVICTMSLYGLNRVNSGWGVDFGLLLGDLVIIPVAGDTRKTMRLRVLHWKFDTNPIVCSKSDTVTFSIFVSQFVKNDVIRKF